MKMHIEFKAGRWLVNGKRLEDLNHDEKNFMNDFFTEMKHIFEDDNKTVAIYQD